MLRRHYPFQYEDPKISDSETESDDLSDLCYGIGKRRIKKGIYIGRAKLKIKRIKKGKNIGGEGSGDTKASMEISDPDAMVKKSETYQAYMKQIPIPAAHGAASPFKTWQDLAKYMKQLYGQPLHYLTNVLIKQWDESRIDGEDEDKALDTILDPSKAEATVWHVEEVHRKTTSYHHLAKLWLSDLGYLAFVDPEMSKP